MPPGSAMRNWGRRKGREGGREDIRVSTAHMIARYSVAAQVEGCSGM